ncbi:hypothetical protein NA78x_003471 [Anatilimnocola sp. NA78]|uniref:hypothetical protein n=1 Tax=Anatilimnocola sp. NA78 TaxID=3415683 RepID=UPI003CE4C540
MKRDARAPLIVAIVLLLLPVLYVGSYLALVEPGGVRFTKVVSVGSQYRIVVIYETYRYGGNWADRIFWPAEQIDRKVRPETLPPMTYDIHDNE